MAAVMAPDNDVSDSDQLRLDLIERRARLLAEEVDLLASILMLAMSPLSPEQTVAVRAPLLVAAEPVTHEETDWAETPTRRPSSAWLMRLSSMSARSASANVVNSRTASCRTPSGLVVAVDGTIVNLTRQ